MTGGVLGEEVVGLGLDESVTDVIFSVEDLGWGEDAKELPRSMVELSKIAEIYLSLMPKLLSIQFTLLSLRSQGSDRL
jgi:hypothetical protein